MDLSKFVSLLSTKSIWMARADQFKDESEGGFHLEMQETLKKAYENFDLDPSDKIKNEAELGVFIILCHRFNLHPTSQESASKSRFREWA